jgi:hypothetical protein
VRVVVSPTLANVTTLWVLSAVTTQSEHFKYSSLPHRSDSTVPAGTRKCCADFPKPNEDQHLEAGGLKQSPLQSALWELAASTPSD